MSFSTPFAPAEGLRADDIGIDARRSASWLKSPYSDPVWLVTDTDDEKTEAKIDFRYRMADGRCLTETARLYATVKEFAFFVRDGRFSKIDTAFSHKAAVFQQMALAHALTLKGIRSYAHLQRGDVEDFVQGFRFGIDGILQASQRVQGLIQRIENDLQAQQERYRGFPVARTPQGFSKNMIDLDEFLASCRLPNSVKLLPRVSWLIATAAIRNGMAPTTKKERPKTIPPLANVTIQQLQRSLDCLDLLFAMRLHAECEVPKFRPFPNGVMRVANQYGVESETTPVPPPKLVLHLLEAASKWVGNYSEPVLAALGQMADVSKGSAGRIEAAVGSCLAGFPEGVRGRLVEGSRESAIAKAVQMLATASWVIIAAFSARRYEETVDLEEASLRGSDEEGWWLYCFISKTTREKEWIPVPLLVARAVQVLVSLSASAREQGFEGLFWWVPPPAINDNGPMAISPRRLLNSFADLANTPLPDDFAEAGRWNWIPRQLRRFFAVLYFYRFEGADIAVLSYFLRHFDIETTRGYVTRDPEVSKLWREAEKDYVRRLADSIASGEREVGGTMGERLKKLTKLIKDRLDKHLFVAKETVGETLQHVMERGGLVVTPKAWVTCTCPRTSKAAKKAFCRSGQDISDEIVGPSFADAGPTVCRFCPWALMEPDKQGYASRAQAHLEASVGCSRGEGTLFRELEQNQLVQLTRVTATTFGRASQTPPPPPPPPQETLDV